MIIICRIVFVGALETLAVRNRFLQDREVFGIPPRSLNEKSRRSYSNGKHQHAPDPPYAPACRRSRQKIAIRHREDRHPSPGKLYESQLRKVLPKSRTEASHQNRRRGREQQQHAPQSPCLTALLFLSRTSVRCNPDESACSIFTQRCS